MLLFCWSRDKLRKGWLVPHSGKSYKVKEFQFYPTDENKTWRVVFLENESTISVWK